MIGKTEIDLDDRFFNPAWQQLEHKPIEFRQLYHQSTSLSQGVISMWVEIQEVQKNSKNPKVWSLETEPLRDY